MKSRFTTIDLCASVTELKERLLGMRVNNVSDIDSKTYLIKLQRPEEKAVLLIESGNRMHTTEFEWPKSTFPSGFAMKLRKHLKQRRLVAVTQLGIDRIVDLQFGSNEAAYHLIVEFYDRGNIVLTDHEYVILNLLRRRMEKGSEEKTQEAVGNKEIHVDDDQKSTDKQEQAMSDKSKQGKKGNDIKGKGKEGAGKGASNEDVKFSVGQTYPVGLAKQRTAPVTTERLKEILENCKDGELLKKALNPHFIYGHMLLEHCLIECGLPAGVTIGKSLDINTDLSKVMDAITLAEEYLDQAMSKPCKGYIIQKREKNPSAELVSGGDAACSELLTFQEFHPFLLTQHKSLPYIEKPSFDKSVDEFFSSISSQKLDVKALNQEKSALKKLENVKKDHEKRIHQLQHAQAEDMRKAELVEINLPLVDQAILVVNSAIANQIDWSEIQNIVKEAQMQGDPVACAIKDLKLDTNHMTMLLSDSFDASDDSGDENDDDDSKKKKKKNAKGVKVDINLALSAYANARSFYVKKKHSAIKEQKTIDHSGQALKSAKRKAKQTLKEVATTTSINKARKTYWFEKFLWFISSENYVVIGGRDQQQNELVVKRHLQPGDVYVHADLHGASSVVVKNKPGGQPIPPKTLQEAGSMAVCYSVGWESKIVTSAWWVYHYQVSKTAPTGEYLTTGSFMIRGKKNFLPPTHLIMGFSFLFRVDDSCMERHRNERRVRGLDDNESLAESTVDIEGDEELSLADVDSDNEDRKDDVTTIEKADDVISTSEGSEKAGDVTSPSDDVTNKDSDVIKVDDVTSSAVVGDEDDVPGSLYPDTSINLHIVSGKVKLQRGVSNTSSQPELEEEQIFLGDEHVINLRENKEKAFQVSKERKAKQKRNQPGETKKNTDKLGNNENGEGQIEEFRGQQKKGSIPQQQQETQQQQIKKGKKAKLKKMKEKYGDQDEEERRIRMEILASAGLKRETKADKRKAKKANKGMYAQGKGKQNFKQNVTALPWEQNVPDQSGQGKSDKHSHNEENSELRNTEPIKTNGEPTNLCSDDVDAGMRKDVPGDERNGRDLAVASGCQGEGTKAICDDVPDDVEALKAAGPRQAWEEGGASRQGVLAPDREKSSAPSSKDDVIDDIDDDEDDNPQDSKENVSILDALTGIPVADDVMLFAIPVCAPYTAVQNYKYKVKLTPGTNRKGKAAKSALNAFIHSKEASQREKDLLKSVKDTDLARYFPGKVKVSAPNLQKLKRK